MEYAEAHLTQDTIKVPTDQVDGLFYFPGCHVLHYLNNVVQDQVTADMGTWQICFAAIPDKTMTIYYYQDDLTNIIPPWKPLETTTKNGIACADIVDWSGVYAPVGK